MITMVKNGQLKGSKNCLQAQVWSIAVYECVSWQEQGLAIKIYYKTQQINRDTLEAETEKNIRD